MPNHHSHDRSFWIIIAVAVVCGLSAGILGEIITRVYILKDFSSAFSSEVNLSNLNANNSGLIIRDPKKVVVNQDLKVAETVNNIRPVLVGLFKEVATSSLAVSSDKTDYYKLDEPLFVGLIITSDGWVMALAPAEFKNNFKFKNYIAIGSDRRVYRIDKLANLKNLPGDPLVFHLAGAANLPVKKIISRAELTLGESLLAIGAWDSVWPTTLNSLVKMPTVLSSDALNVRLSLAEIGSLNNSFVFDLAGNLAAIITADQEIIPAFSYNSAWSVLATGGKSKRPYLGVNYLDLSLVKSLSLDLDKGAWLYPSATQPALVKDSPAALAGLKVGDVITWVNNQKIEAGIDLADLIAAHQPGDVITLTYWRAGAEKSVELKLGELK